VGHVKEWKRRAYRGSGRGKDGGKECKFRGRTSGNSKIKGKNLGKREAKNALRRFVGG